MNDDPPRATAPAPPGHLSGEARQFWDRVATTHGFCGRDLGLLQTCCEAWDQMLEARSLMRVGAGDAPAGGADCAVERDRRFAFRRLARELGLGPDEMPESPQRRLAFATPASAA